MEMNAEEFAVQDNTGNHQTILALIVWLLVIIVLELELMIVAAVLMDFI
jgi:hypothetical protein